MTQSRRDFFGHIGLLGASMLASQIGLASGKPNPVILFTSGWQDVNIGDIAHTPGLIALLTKRLPQAKLILWKRSKSQKVETMLTHYYPDLRIIHGNVTDSVPQSEEVRQAFKEADFFLHGSGPMVVAADYLEAWHKQTRKPYGLFGVTIPEVYPSLKPILASASLIFTRETASIEVLRRAGLVGNHIAFAPDATFALTIRDETKAKAFLEANDLKSRQFICAIPRLRVTPYYRINTNSSWSEQKIREVDELNDKWKEIDHAKLREAMIAWVRSTGNKVLVCPEMTYQADLLDELLIDPLPADVKAKVVKHLYWLPDEAAAVYEHAHTVLSFECHSPIIAAVNGTPCFYLRQPQDTIKGQMYYDLGLDDWTFEIEQTTGQQITNRLMEVTANYKAARDTVRKALATVEGRYDKTFRLVKETWQT